MMNVPSAGHIENTGVPAGRQDLPSNNQRKKRGRGLKIKWWNAALEVGAELSKLAVVWVTTQLEKLQGNYEAYKKS